MLRAFLLATCLALGWSTSADEVRQLAWKELIPSGVEATITQGKPAKSALDSMLSSEVQPPAPVVESLNEQRVRVPGFVVPLESDEAGDLTEFFLVPYYGACIHVPPPPANQIIYVKVQEDFFLESMMDPYWVEGVLFVASFSADLGEAGYTLKAEKIEKYEF